jgi:ribosomal protein S18 acetylase RimI-like enzyme
MVSPDFRPATVADLPRISEIHVDSWDAAYRGLIDDGALDERTVDVRLEQWRELMEDPPGGHIVAVAEVDGAIVGFIRAGHSDDDDVDPETTVNVFALYLDPARRGEGVGRDLLRWTLDRYAERGFKVATLYSLVGNEPARRFYERNGWTLDEGVIKECLGDGYKAPQVRYRLRLDSRSGAPVS